MRALVDDILDMARIETDGVTLNRTAFDLERLGREAVQLWSDKVAAKGLILTCDLSQAPGRIVEDAGRLRQIVFALLSNAVKFTDQGTVRLSAAAEPGPSDERLILQVVDTGPGIPPDKLAEVFEPFGQVDSSRTRAHGGAGLGLAICRRLVDAMGGEIRLDSTVGVGTTATVDLPLERAGATAVAPVTPALQDCGVLFCDSSPLTRAVTAAVLRPNVRDLRAVDGRQEVLDAARGERFDLALIEAAELGHDLDMRRATLGALREALAPAPIVALLARDAGDGEADLLAGGAALVVRKPVTAADLVAALAALLEKPAPADHGVESIATA
jgi:CheY-like chemotaxis protein/anti-sigma regulatory factor (Ser/Thr protein kinase)